MGSMAMMIGMGAFFATLIASRRIKERAFAALTDEQKLALLDSFSGNQALRMIPMAVLVLLFLAISQRAPESSTLITGVFWLGCLVYGAVTVTLNTLRLRRLDLPPAYTRSWLLGRALVFGGILTLLAAGFLASRS